MKIVRVDQKPRSSYHCLPESPSKYKDRLKVKGWQKIWHANINQNKAEVGVLILDRADF